MDKYLFRLSTLSVLYLNFRVKWQVSVAQMADFFFEVLPVVKSGILDLSPIVIDGVDRVSEQGSDLGRLGYSKAYESEYPEFSSHQFTLFGFYPGFGLKKGVELLYEIGVKIQERLVEELVELLEFIFDEFTG